MEPLPAALASLAASIAWPKPRPDGTTHLDAQTLRQIQAIVASLVNYVDTQLARCKMPKDAPPPPETAAVLVR